MRKICLLMVLFMALVLNGAYAETNLDDLVLSGGLTLGGEKKSSWGSVVSPMTDYDGYTATTDAGSKLKLHDDGDITRGGAVATDVVTIWDGNADDFYMGLDDSADDLVIGYGSTVGTDVRLAIVDDTNATTITIGDGVNSYDKTIVLDGDAIDFSFGYDDSGDTFSFSRGSALGTAECFNIPNSATPALTVTNGLDGEGAVDIDYGSADVTDHTFVSDGGTLILDGTVSLTEAEVISNATDDTVRVASNDLDMVLEVYSPYATNGDATLLLTADADADAGDRAAIVHDGATNSLLFQSDTDSADTLATIMTLAKTGILTTTSYINQVITDSNTASVVDVAKLTHDGGTAASGVGTGLVFQVDDEGGIEEQGSIDVALSDVTDAAEEADLVIKLNQAGTMRDVYTIDTDVSTTLGTVHELDSWTVETNAVIDMLELTLDNTADTATDDFGAGISIILEQEDSGTPVQQASVDFTLVDSSTGVEDCDVILSQTTAGTVAETLRVVANSSATTSDALQFTANTTETNAVVDVLKLVIATGTATDNSGMGISFEPEDATGSEQHASIDIVQTTAARATNDTDFVFTQDVNGTLTERVRFDADGSSILLSGALPSIMIGDAGAEDTKVEFDGNTQDFHIGLDDTADDLVIGVGSALGTTQAMAIDENTDVTTSGNLIVEGALDIGTVQTFTDSDLTPDVSDGSYFITNTTGATLTDFDGAGIVAGQIIVIESAGAIVYDVTTTGLIGGSTDLTTADGDLTSWIYNGTDWLLISFMDLSDNLS